MRQLAFCQHSPRQHDTNTWPSSPTGRRRPMSHPTPARWRPQSVYTMHTQSTWRPRWQWLECLTFFKDELPIGRLVVRFPIPSPLPIWIPTAMYNLQRHQKPVPTWCGRLKTPLSLNRVGVGFPHISNIISPP